MAYVKTNWVDNVTPLSAANLNKAETQYDQAVIYCNNIADQIKEIINRNTYDDYLRTMELYYTGHFSGPGIVGMKGMTFDGFMDLSRVNTGVTTAYISLADYVAGVTGNGVITEITPSSVVLVSFKDAISGGDYITPPSNLNNMIDNNISTYMSWERSSTSNDYIGIFQFDLGQVQCVSGLNINGALGHNGNLKVNDYIEISTDGNIWEKASLSAAPYFPRDGLNVWVDHPLYTLRNARYIRVPFYFDCSNSSSTVFYIYEVKIKTETPINGQILQSTEKTLTSTISSAKVYLSINASGSASITPTLSADGIHFEAMTFESTRTDPLNGNYTEKCYKVDLSYPGSKAVLKLQFNTNGLYIPVLKRYGLHWA